MTDSSEYGPPPLSSDALGLGSQAPADGRKAAETAGDSAGPSGSGFHESGTKNPDKPNGLVDTETSGGGKDLGSTKEKETASDSKPQHETGGAAASLSAQRVKAASRFVPQRAAPPTALGRRDGFADATVACLEAVAFDLEERGRRLAIVASRHEPGRAALAVAAALTGGAVEAATEPVGLPDLDAVLAPPEAGAPAGWRDGPRALVCEQSLGDAIKGAGFAGMAMRHDASLSLDPVLARLRAENAYLIVALRFDEDSRKVLDHLPEAYLLPWLDPWLADFERRCGEMLRSDVEREVGGRLRSICEDAPSSARTRAHEQELFVRLEALVLLGAPPGQSFEDALKAAVEAAARGEAGRKADAVGRLHAVLADADPIARTLFAVRALVPEESWAGVRRIAQALLPAETVSSPDDLPPRLLGRWHESLAAAESRGEGRPPMPGWREVFAHDADRHVGRSGLQNVDGRISPHADFRLSDPARLLVEHYADLVEKLVADFARAGLYARADVPLESLAAFHLALVDVLDLRGRIVGGRWPNAAAADFARLLAEGPAEGEAAVGTRFGRIAEALGILSIEEGRRGREREPLVDALLAAFAQLLPRAETTLLLAAFLLDQPAGWGQGVAEADLLSGAPALRRASPAVAESEAHRRHALAALVAETDGAAASGGGEGVASVRPWLDGLRACARDGRLAGLGLPLAAVATFAEDFATQASIDLPKGGGQPPAPALARDLFEAGGEPAPGTAPAHGLIARMLAREPRQWLADLEAYERFAAPKPPAGNHLDRIFRLDDAVYWRLRDVLAVLLGGIEADDLARLAEREMARFLSQAPEAVPRPGGVRAAGLLDFGEPAWPALSRELGLPSLGSLEAARDRVLAAHQGRPPRPGAPDGTVLLSLYPAALLVEWRLRCLGEAPIDAGHPLYDRQRRLFGAVRDALEAAGARPRAARAFRALEVAQARLADRADTRRLATTARRYRDKARLMGRLAAFLAPAAPPPAVFPTFDFGAMR